MCVFVCVSDNETPLNTIQQFTTQRIQPLTPQHRGLDNMTHPSHRQPTTNLPLGKKAASNTIPQHQLVVIKQDSPLRQQDNNNNTTTTHFDEQ
ncbi:hypothetical protein BDR22DRAFT_289195 [Usnea florida]